LDCLTVAILIMATWNIYFATPVCSEGQPELYLQDIWSSTKAMWIVMLTVLFGIWHRVVALSSAGLDESMLACDNLEPDISVKSEVFKSWRSR